jgi:XTP/dITP diphosphohydrolase
MKQFVLASNNAGKLREINQILAGLDWQALPQSEFSIGDVEETGTTFVENAIIKARHAADIAGLPALADDSGIVVDALQGEPGVYSARYAGKGASDQANLEKLLDNIKSVPQQQRNAHFQCVMVFMRHARDPSPIIAEGSWHGFIVDKPAGDNGFGYDPIFWVPEHNCTSAQLAPEMKNQLSHRGKALKQLLSLLNAELNQLDRG